MGKTGTIKKIKEKAEKPAIEAQTDSEYFQANPEVKQIDITENNVVLKSWIVGLVLTIASLFAIILGIGATYLGVDGLAFLVALGPVLIVLGIVGFCCFCRFTTIYPNEANVYTFFGKYIGTLRKPGAYWVYPFWRCGAKTSLKMLTLNNGIQKVNDELGNPIEIGVIVVWRITNTARACFVVDNYNDFISIQADSSVRHVARLYPYDSEEGGEKSLRGSTNEIAKLLRIELQSRVKAAGIEIIEARIAHLAYAAEIASAMLQRQQATAIIEARQKIVEGAVGMVETTLKRLEQEKICKFDESAKAATVSNLLIVLCSNKDAQPVLNIAKTNTGSNE